MSPTFSAGRGHGACRGARARKEAEIAPQRKPKRERAKKNSQTFFMKPAQPRSCSTCAFMMRSMSGFSCSRCPRRARSPEGPMADLPVTAGSSGRLRSASAAAAEMRLIKGGLISPPRAKEGRTYDEAAKLSSGESKHRVRPSAQTRRMDGRTEGFPWTYIPRACKHAPRLRLFRRKGSISTS